MYVQIPLIGKGGAALILWGRDALPNIATSHTAAAAAASQ